MANLYIGTSGYAYQEWRGQFYPKGVPQKDWLAYYASRYNAVEVNATFYRPFEAKVYAHWGEVTPDEFRFVVKGPKVITHEKALENIDEELESFVANTAALGDKLAAMLWQFPASAHADNLLVELAHFLRVLPKNTKQVFEFRHISWLNNEVYDLLNIFGAGFVITDVTKFSNRQVTTDHIMYLRFHGPNKLYNSLYTPQQLQVWAETIRPYLGQKDVYVFFNNTMGGQALQNANELRDMLLEDKEGSS
ncbi:MAG: DUF72 domain-containing protein [Chloroflexi bacterium]|nr:DUF72 domain-containing protein [Chloroflexota bacterium]MCC6895860.1 DUF72 domain-containing protein [Anaerolineae bacterium]